MYEKQHTLKQAISLDGVGLHTGIPCTLSFLPAAENTGISFRRTDLPGNPEVPANLDYVVDLQRSTTIQRGEAKVITVEHVLAALAGMQVDNCIVELSGPEPPAMDGSSLPFVQALKQAGFQEQQADREFYVIDEPVHYYDHNKKIDLAALKFDDFRITVMVDYNSQQLGIQHATMVGLPDFEQEIASNRTFCFLHELQYLMKEGLIRGGNLKNSVVFVEKAVPAAELNTLKEMMDVELNGEVKPGILGGVSLRYDNEPARHKLLDLLGDLTLLGNPLRAQIVAMRPGHASNIAFARQIQEKLKKKKRIKQYQNGSSASNVVFDINAIQRILPHRYPFLLVDRITEFTENSITGIKNVTINEPFFVGHFDGGPIMPGVLQVEAMGQVGGILLLNIIDGQPEEYWVYFLAIDKVRFKKPVVPGDQLVFKLTLDSLKRGICKMTGKAYVDGQLASEAELVASLVKKNKA
ncbi:MAG: bifunctional UDP-3-O-[3-hydroxymyristoyl] N-acetylglucosamine deacetylase/3-hydroxyacyl-ACP dehydratase [Bacteroidetes bacterium]|jgi:UDP-3-O-[3-hydroxymyristoyl] N-acetylglucosamine deacetylase/3-hydroxyacyl-[acyl-carrier-protein] dehydratase|nr:bifunctional UDP-3-O-[3-hydroxymyristoyl] N-acetylglucosamine deacetylase/3-hydroxyacyl-ACP dehydratase [Bacteroidota bacterium]